jgi:murein DD-endopeptidase MepM/ murein hydrolase activator NlpD
VASRGVTVVVHSDGSTRSREYRIPLWMVRAILVTAAVVAVFALIVGVAYGPILAAAARAPLLDRRVAQLTAENRRVVELERALDDAEARYAQIRGMLGAQLGPPPGASTAARETSGVADRLYVAPPILARAPAAPGESAGGDAGTGPSIPHVWPLAVPSYRTRGMVGADSLQEEHPGIDLAVPVGSDVRASGGGVVRQVGEDPAYGIFVLIQHPGGYQTMYGHLSRVLVQRNDMVRAGQVVALSGSTGRSTAPHLHFEVRLQGRSLDPTTLVREGR